MLGFPSGPESLISSIMHEYSLINDATRCSSEVVRNRRHSWEMKSGQKHRYICSRYVGRLNTQRAATRQDLKYIARTYMYNVRNNVTATAGKSHYNTTSTDPLPPSPLSPLHHPTHPLPRHGCTSQSNKSTMSFLLSSSMVSGSVLRYEFSNGFHPSCPPHTACRSRARRE